MSEGVNVNTNTAAAPEPIVATGTGVTDFDELERVGSLDKGKSKAKEPKETKEPKEAKEPKEKAEPKDKKADKDAQAKAKKLLKAKLADAELDLDPDAMVDVTVDGKPVPVKIQELLNNYSGKVAYDKRFSELDVQRKAYQTERSKTETAIKRFYDTAVTKGDTIGALQVLAEEFGANPTEIRQAYLKRLVDTATHMQGKTPEEISAMLEGEELKALRAREAEHQARAEEAKIKANLQTRIDKVISESGMSESEFTDAYHQLKQHGVSDITPETVGLYVKELKARTFIHKSLLEAKPDFEDAKLSDAIESIRATQVAQGLSEADIADIVKSVYGVKSVSKAEKLAKKVTGMGSAAPKAVNPRHEPLNFDELI